MFTPTKPSITVSDLTFSWPNGDSVFKNINATFSNGTTGLIGDNGTGKSTLLKLIAGQLTVQQGNISTIGTVGYLPQQLTLQTEWTVADLLGISDRLQALKAIESGDASIENFDILADDWEVESRAFASLDKLGITNIELSRPVGTLSGGEAILIALLGLMDSDHEIIMLDEPTNNLDSESRQRLHQLIRSWHKTLIVVSHDVELLDQMDRTAELHNGQLNTFGGTFSEYQLFLSQQQLAAEQALQSAEQQLKVEKRQRIEAQTKIARRERSGRTDYVNKRMPKIMMNKRKADSQASAGKLRVQLDGKIEQASKVVEEMADKVRTHKQISIELPDPQVPPSRRLVEFQDHLGNTYLLQGPERVALIGRNGIGKTCLLESMLSKNDQTAHQLPVDPKLRPPSPIHTETFTDLIGYLPQRLDHLADEQDIFETIRLGAPKARPQQIRANLAAFLFRGDIIYRQIGALSGGERFRVALASLLLSDPPNQLLVLDEPTNNLDLKSIDELVEALNEYRGGLLVVSHDQTFLQRIGIQTRLLLDKAEDGETILTVEQ